MEDKISKMGKVLPYFGAMVLSLIMATVALAEGQKGLEEKEFHRFWPDNLYAVEFVNDKTGFIAGYSGSLFRTEDGGESWDGIYLGVSELIRHVSFVDEKTGWAVGHQGSILHTSDSGTTWETQKKDEGIYLRDISFADKNNGWAVGHAAKIWHTSDGGKNWESQSLTGFGGRDLPRLHSVVAKDANSAILVGEFGVVAHTENAGKLWMVSYNPHKNTILSIAKSDQGAVAVGLDGGIFNITLATDEQRAEVKAIEEERLAKIEAKAIKKAQRRKKVYVPKVVEPLPETEIDYYITKIDSGTKEHIYDVSETPNGDAIAVGAHTVVKISADTVTPLTPMNDFPLPFVWVGGVSVTPSGDIWAAGIRGMVVKGQLEKMEYGMALNIAAPGKVKLVSNRWGEK